MQFAMMIYRGAMPTPGTEAWDGLPEEEQQAIYAGYAAINRNPAVTPGIGLGPAESATTVRVVDGEVVTSGGPFAGTDGALGGYLVFEAEDEAEAIGLAATIPPASRGGAIEIRRVVQY